MGYNWVFVRVNGRTDKEAESENKFHFMTKRLPFKLELEKCQMVVFNKEKRAKLRLPYCIDFKRTCVKDVTP